MKTRHYNWVGDKKLQKFIDETGGSYLTLAYKLAELSGRPISRQSVSKWANGEYCPDAKVLPYLADIICGGEIKKLFKETKG